MRKVDVIILVSLVALGATFLRPRPPAGGTPSPTYSPMFTRSHWEILPCPFEIAGLSLGMTGAEIEARLGVPADKHEDQETSTWTYRSDGADLHLTLLEGRLLVAGGSGRWSLTEQGQPRPGFMASQEEVRAAFGEPQRRDKEAWVYTPRPNEVTFHFANGRVSQVWIATEIKGRPLSTYPTPKH